MSTSTRKSVRDALLGKAPEFKKEIVEYEGIEVEIRQPSMKVRKQVMKRATDKEGNTDIFDFLIWSVIENTYFVGSDEKIFEDTDYDSLVERPSGGFMDKFGEVAASLMNVEEDVSEKAKN